MNYRVPRMLEIKHMCKQWLPRLSSSPPAPQTARVASSPGPSQLFSLAGKNERAWGLKSRDKCWQNGVALALPQSVDFKPIRRLWLIKRSSVRPLRIVLPSLIVGVAFFFTLIEQDRLKIVIAHVQFSWSATLGLPTGYPIGLAPSILVLVRAYVTHVTLDPRLSLFSHVRWKDRGAWGWG